MLRSTSVKPQGPPTGLTALDPFAQAALVSLPSLEHAERLSLHDSKDFTLLTREAACLLPPFFRSSLRLTCSERPWLTP